MSSDRPTRSTDRVPLACRRPIEQQQHAQTGAGHERRPASCLRSVPVAGDDLLQDLVSGAPARYFRRCSPSKATDGAPCHRIDGDLHRCLLEVHATRSGTILTRTRTALRRYRAVTVRLRRRTSCMACRRSTRWSAARCPGAGCPATPAGCCPGSAPGYGLK